LILIDIKIYENGKKTRKHLIENEKALTIETEKGEKGIERTPCMGEGITDHIWTWRQF